jgi:hypothetical protein
VDYRDRGRTDSQKIIAMAVVRYREENGDLSRKHGSILIGTLRKLTASVSRPAVPTMQN